MTVKRIAFLGSGKMLMEIIKIVRFSNEFKICGVILHSDLIGRNSSPNSTRNVNAIPMCKTLEKNKIFYEDMNEIKTLKHSKILQQNLDIVIVCGWYSLLPRDIFNQTNVFGLHASLLPKNAGWAPLVWSILNGEEKTGITLFRIDEGVDTGPIIAQKEVRISNKDNIYRLQTKIIKATKIMMKDFLDDFSRNSWTEISQEKSKRTLNARRYPTDGKIGSEMSSRTIYNFVRAQSKPYPGAFFEYKNINLYVEKVKIKNSKFSQKNSGKIIIKGINVYLGSSDGWVKITKFRYKKQKFNLIKSFYRDFFQEEKGR